MMKASPTVFKGIRNTSRETSQHNVSFVLCSISFPMEKKKPHPLIHLPTPDNCMFYQAQHAVVYNTNKNPSKQLVLQLQTKKTILWISHCKL